MLKMSPTSINARMDTYGLTHSLNVPGRLRIVWEASRVRWWNVLGSTGSEYIGVMGVPTVSPHIKILRIKFRWTWAVYIEIYVFGNIYSYDLFFLVLVWRTRTWFCLSILDKILFRSQEAPVGGPGYNVAHLKINWPTLSELNLQGCYVTWCRKSSRTAETVLDGELNSQIQAHYSFCTQCLCPTIIIINY